MAKRKSTPKTPPEAPQNATPSTTVKRCEPGAHCPHVWDDHLVCCRCDYRSEAPASIVGRGRIVEPTYPDPVDFQNSVCFDPSQVVAIHRRLRSIVSFSGQRVGPCEIARWLIGDFERMLSEKKAAAEERTLVHNEALCEIRVTIHDSLETAINLWLESGRDSLADAAMLIRPAVERLEAICKGNGFPE